MNLYDKELAKLRVVLIVRGMALDNAKLLIENHFGALDWPPASGGSTRVSVSKNISIEIKVED